MQIVKAYRTMLKCLYCGKHWETITDQQVEIGMKTHLFECTCLLPAFQEVIKQSNIEWSEKD